MEAKGYRLIRADEMLRDIQNGRFSSASLIPLWHPISQEIAHLNQLKRVISFTEDGNTQIDSYELNGEIVSVTFTIDAAIENYAKTRVVLDADAHGRRRAIRGVGETLAESGSRMSVVSVKNSIHRRIASLHLHSTDESSSRVAVRQGPTIALDDVSGHSRRVVTPIAAAAAAAANQRLLAEANASGSGERNSRRVTANTSRRVANDREGVSVRRVLRQDEGGSVSGRHCHGTAASGNNSPNDNTRTSVRISANNASSLLMMN
jgi:hypothetical protein